MENNYIETTVTVTLPEKHYLLEISKFVLGNPELYEIYREAVKKNGYYKIFFEGKPYNVFNPATVYILQNEIPVFNIIDLGNPGEDLDFDKPTKKEDFNINGQNYLKYFAGGYNKGVLYFENHFKVSPNTLYGINGESYVRDICFHYFADESGLHQSKDYRHENQFIFYPPGHYNEKWDLVKRRITIQISPEAITEIGYYHGILSKVDLLIKTYPSIFEKYQTQSFKFEGEPEPEPIPETKPFIYPRPDTPLKLYNGLKTFFNETDYPELKKALNFEPINGRLFFPDTQSKLCELFLRLYYNGLISGQKTMIAKWVYETFSRKNKHEKIEPFNKDTIWATIGQSRNEPGKGKRLLEDLAPYLPKSKRKEAPEAIK